MANPHDVAVLVGSLRRDSINRKVAHALIELAPSSLKPQIVEIGQLPLYNQDGDTNPPDHWTAFRQRIRRADAVLFVTPEHNRSVPAALKNAIDVGWCSLTSPRCSNRRRISAELTSSSMPAGNLQTSRHASFCKTS